MTLNKRKKHADASASGGLVQSLRESVELLRERLARAFSPSLPTGGFNLAGDQERQRAIDYCWAGDFGDCTSELLTTNPDLNELLAAKSSNKYNTSSLYSDESEQRRVCAELPSGHGRTEPQPELPAQEPTAHGVRVAAQDVQRRAVAALVQHASVAVEDVA